MADSTTTVDDIRRQVAQMLGQTAPLRSGVVQPLQAVLGGAPASSLPAYAPNRAAMEGQFSQARNTLMESLPRGGYLTKALADLEGKRAEGVAGLESSMRNNAFNQSAQIGFGQVPSLLGTDMSTAGLLAQAEAADKARKQQKTQATAQGWGMGAGLLAGLISGLWGD